MGLFQNKENDNKNTEKQLVNETYSDIAAETTEPSQGTKERKYEPEQGKFIDVSQFKPLPARPRENLVEKVLARVIMIACCVLGLITLLRPSVLGVPIMCCGIIPYIFVQASYASKKKAYNDTVAANLEILFPGSAKKPGVSETIGHTLFFAVAICITIAVGTIVYSRMPICSSCGAHCIGLLKSADGSEHYCFVCFIQNALSGMQNPLTAAHIQILR